jgi:hypothetical protein
VRGNLATFVFPRRAGRIVPGYVYWMRWSLYRDRLTSSKVPGRLALDALVITRWIRVR